MSEQSASASIRLLTLGHIVLQATEQSNRPTRRQRDQERVVPAASKAVGA